MCMYALSATVPRRHEGRGPGAIPSLLPLVLGLGRPSLPRVGHGMNHCREPPSPPSRIHPPGSHDFLATVFHPFFTPLSRRQNQIEKCRNVAPGTQKDLQNGAQSGLRASIFRFLRNLVFVQLSMVSVDFPGSGLPQVANKNDEKPGLTTHRQKYI